MRIDLVDSNFSVLWSSFFSWLSLGLCTPFVDCCHTDGQLYRRDVSWCIPCFHASVDDCGTPSASTPYQSVCAVSLCRTLAQSRQGRLTEAFILFACASECTDNQGYQGLLGSGVLTAGRFQFVCELRCHLHFFCVGDKKRFEQPCPRRCSPFSWMPTKSKMMARCVVDYRHWRMNFYAGLGMFSWLQVMHDPDERMDSDEAYYDAR